MVILFEIITFVIVVIDEEREFYLLYQTKDWVKLKEKTRQMRLNETESDMALRTG